jgi:phage shock protein A
VCGEEKDQVNTFKRMTTAVRVSLDRVLTQVENHEAVTQTALEELRRHLARARSHASRVKRDGDGLRDEHDKARHAAEMWRKRAVDTEEHSAALECVRRSRDAAAHAERLQARLSEHAQVTRRLTKEIRSLEERYTELNSRKRVLQARDAEARALEITEGSVHEVGSDVESLLERWELTIDERCYQVADPETDDFEVGYLEAEEKADLEAELLQLRGQQ